MSDKKLETLILASNFHSETFRRKVLTKTQKEYFQYEEAQAYFGIVDKFFAKYGAMPNKDAMEIEIANSENLKQETFEDLKKLNEEVFSEKFQKAVKDANFDWLVNQTQNYFRDRAIYNAIMQSMDIIDGTDKKTGTGAIPEMLQKALNVNFDDGDFHDYFEDAEERYDFFHQPDNRIPFKLKMLNFVTKGGLLKKTMNIYIAPTGVGKTFALCDDTAFWLMAGYNVMYVTCEMSEEVIAQRIDANLMDLEVDDLTGLPKSSFVGKIQKLKAKTNGRLVVKEFAPGCLTAAEFGMVLDDLAHREDFKPDIVVLDYLNLAAQGRYRGEVNTYLQMKAVSEEWRGLAKKKDFCLVTATQTNRGGQGASDYDLNEMSDGHSTSMTADLIIAMISTEELERINQMRLKLLKNRYGSMSPGSWLIGIERAKMKRFDVDKPNAQLERNVAKADSEGEASSGGKPIQQKRRPLEV